MGCLICEKHRGKEKQPPGEYIYEDRLWKVCHAYRDRAVPGQLYVESVRHFLDFSDMTRDEYTSYGTLLKMLYDALRDVTNAERIYCMVMLEGVPHFHAHLVPRTAQTEERGMRFLNKEWSCSEEEASFVANRLRDLLN